MGSHKHKKKRKDSKLKRKKRDVSLSSSDGGEQGMRWNIPSTDTDSDDSNEEKLTALVRESYMKHLLQALTKNFQASTHFSDSISSMVNQCTLALEQKIVKSCTRSNIYRTNMAVLINRVKTSTSDGKPFVEGKKLLNMKSKLPVSKECQTDDVIPCKNSTDFGTQTDPQLTSLLSLPLPKDLSPPSRPYDPAIEFSDSLSSNEINSFSIKDAIVTTSSNQDICNTSITSTSDLVHHNQSSCEYNSHMTLPNQINRSSLGSFESNHQGKPDKEKIDDDINKEIALLLDKKSIEVSSIVLQPDHNTNKTSISSSTACKDNLDSRLTAMGLFNEIDNETDNLFSQVQTSKCKKNNWYFEEIAQSCNLTRILLKMSTTQRQRILKRFKELFGDSGEHHTELSDKNIQICRKRIASVVVKELTPIYQAKKIASRHLFKFLAKQITRSLMNKSYAPDTRCIRWKVNDVFKNGNVIMTESDCEYQKFSSRQN